MEYEARKERYRPTAEDRGWLWRRLGYYGLQLLLFLAIVYRVGPNLFLFHSPFSPGPETYVPFAVQYAPLIAGIKAYQRDFGKLPFGSWDLPPAYMPPNFKGEGGDILSTTSITFPVGKMNVLEYEFSPAREGWIIHSPRYDGRIPGPIVEAAPTPASRPSSGPATSVSDGG